MGSDKLDDKHKKICHMTSAHFWKDGRIFLKECRSLANAGYDVYYVVEGIDREVGGVHIIGCGTRPTSRKERMISFTRVIYEKALSLNCDVYHFHDPELLHYGVRLKEQGKKVIFDSHEDVPGQILGKEWLPFPLRKIISVVYKIYETLCVRKFDAVVTATLHIAEQFRGRASTVIDINNYPKLDEVIFHEKQFTDRDAIICYAGGISELRGEKIMLDVMNGLDAELILAGDYDKNGVCVNKTDNVTYLGYVTRENINNLYGKAIAGLVLLLPNPNYLWSQPVKMYEYMAAGLPFICSDFPLWRKLVEESGAGICVPLNDIGKIQDAIKFLIEHRDEAQRMGCNGYRFVKERYNWEIEEAKLLQLYESLCQ